MFVAFDVFEGGAEVVGGVTVLGDVVLDGIPGGDAAMIGLTGAVLEGFSLSFSAAGLVAEQVDADAEEPGLEAALFVVAVEVADDADEGGLGEFLGEVAVATLSEEQAVEAWGVGLDEGGPGCTITSGGCGERRVQGGAGAGEVRRLHGPRLDG